MRLGDLDALNTDVALFMTGNAYLNMTALDVLKMVSEWIAEAPTIDAVPVVRCRDCKHWHEGTQFCEEHSYFVDDEGMPCSPAESPNWKMFNPDDFCSFGERKGD